ncbi:MAG: YceI family protein [Gammaproteobacteria bacterium]|nr:YceI family protein [Gammaproteobacteria bacterium]
MKKLSLLIMSALISMTMQLQAQATEYKIDTRGAHAFVQFRIKHLGFSWLYGRFDKFNGNFVFDKSDPKASSVQVNIDTRSLNSNHAERDKHLRSADFLDVAKFPTASFISTSFIPGKDDTAKLNGKLTLHGVTKEISIDVTNLGGGKDPWGGDRQGFSGTTEIALKDFGIDFDLGPASQTVEIMLDVEGIKI